MSDQFHHFLRSAALFFSVSILWGGLQLSLLSAPALAESDATQSNIRTHALRPLEEGVQRWTLPNGMRVLFYRRTNAPVFAGEVWVRAGGVDERPGITGIAHFLEHMAFKGTKIIGTKDFAAEEPLLAELDQLLREAPDQNAAIANPRVQELYKQLETIWVDNEFGRLYTSAGASGLNAMTAKDYTAYVVSLPSVAFELWCWMESDRIANPVFRQFYKEREVVQEERRRGYDDDPGGKLYEKLLDLSFTSHPNRLPVIGYSADLKRLTTEEMREFYNSHYHPENMVISIVGDLDPKEIRPVIERYFSRIKARGPRAVGDPAPEPAQTAERRAVLSLDAKPQILIAYHKPTVTDPADAHFSVLHGLLSDGRSSVFPVRLVEDRKVALHADTGEAPGERYDNLFLVAATPAPGVSTQRVVDEVQQIFDEYLLNAPDPKKVEEAKKRGRLGFLKLLDSDSGLAGALGKEEALHGDWRHLIRLYGEIERTTPKDIQNLSRRFLRPENRTVVSIESEKK